MLGRVSLVRFILSPLPNYSGNRLRAWVFSLFGFRIGSGTVFWGTPTVTGPGDSYSRLTIGKDCWINIRVLLNLGASITIGDRVALGHEVMLMTETHAMAGIYRRAGQLEAHPITIGTGAWLGTRCTVLPGVNIGEGAVVAAGAVVTKDVPPHVLVAGVPARVVRTLSSDTE